MTKQNTNAVQGEVIAHILNGVINKPARDALLLRHAIQDIVEKNKDDDIRYDLLISRLVRLHWDKVHLAKVKKAYYDKGKRHLESDIQDAIHSEEFSGYLYDLCQTQARY